MAGGGRRTSSPAAIAFETGASAAGRLLPLSLGLTLSPCATLDEHWSLSTVGMPLRLAAMQASQTGGRPLRSRGMTRGVRELQVWGWARSSELLGRGQATAGGRAAWLERGARGGERDEGPGERVRPTLSMSGRARGWPGCCRAGERKARNPGDSECAQATSAPPDQVCRLTAEGKRQVLVVALY